jgi:hypothetical protein
MFYSIQQDKRYIWTIISTLIVIGLAFNLFLWQIRFLGLIFLIVFFVINGLWLGQILKKILFAKEDAYFCVLQYRRIEIFSFLFGILLLIYLIGFLGVIFLIFYKFSIVQIPLIFGILTLIISFLIHRNVFTRLENSVIHNGDKIDNSVSNKRGKIKFSSFLRRFACHSVDNVIVDKFSFKKTWKYLLGLFFLFLVGLFLLCSVRTENYIQSPWDVIPKIYLYVYLIATLIVVFLIFSKQKISFVLFVIILHSFLLHAYLPIVYKAGFGENKWKHLGIEKQILSVEKNFAPSIENKNGSANQWVLTIFLSKILNIDIFWVDLLLLYLLWSIFIPLIFFELARFLFQSFKGPPTFIKTASFTKITMKIKSIDKSDDKLDDENVYCKKQRFLLLTAFLPSLFFSFQVYGSVTTSVALVYLFFFFVLLFWLDYLVTKQKISLIAAIILSLLTFFGYQINFFDLFGLITQNSLYQDKENIQNFALFFSEHLLIIINFCIFSFIILGIFKIKKIPNQKVGYFLIIGFFILGFLEIFSKNIELGIIFFTIFLLSWGIYCFLNLESEWLIEKQKIIIICFFLAFSSTVVYASGPSLQNSVTFDDLKVAEYIWQEIQNNPKELGHPCILADKRFLLALEAISGRNVIQGGFLNKNQKNGERLFKNITENFSIRHIEIATEITQSLSCYLIVKEGQFKNLNVNKDIKDILENYEKIGKNYIFRYEINVF